MTQKKKLPKAAEDDVGHYDLDGSSVVEIKDEPHLIVASDSIDQNGTQNASVNLVDPIAE